MTSPPASASAPKFLTRGQLKEVKGIGWSNPALLRKERAGLFPKRTHISPKLPVWLESEIDEWMRAKVDGPRERNSVTARATEARARRRNGQAAAR